MSAVLSRKLKSLVHWFSESRTNYYLAYAVDFATPTVLGVTGIWLGTPLLAAAVAFALGVFSFSFVEYSVHRWFFHSPASPLSVIHRKHHEAPAAPTALPFFAGPLGTLLWAYAIQPFVNLPTLCLFLSGLSGGYFWYGLMHHLQHHLPPRSRHARYFRKPWARHVIHHHIEGVNFGVTSSLWDKLLGTDFRDRKRAAASTVATLR